MVLGFDFDKIHLYNKESSNMKYYLSKISILLVFICIFSISSCSQNDKLINSKQWYLENTGDAKQISTSEDYNKYIRMKEDVDIDYIGMLEILKDRDASEEVIVALLDTGVDFNHVGLKNAEYIPVGQKDNKDFDGNFAIEPDSHSVSAFNPKTGFDPHGTACAGVISSRIDGKGIAGIASTRNVKILSIDIAVDNSDQTFSRTEDLISAIQFAELNDAKVCNISFSTEDYNEKLEERIKNSSILFVVSAGNGHPLGYNIDKNQIYPACFNLENVITVGNLNYGGKLDRSSNFGKNCVDIVAPGTCIYTSAEENSYQFRSGTSIATPMVTAVAAVIFSIDNTISASEVKNIIIDSADNYSSLENKIRSSGSLNACNAVKYAQK
jgi:subtilisin family serine protease